jgi:hypothetical protein
MAKPVVAPPRGWAWERWAPLAGVGAVVLWLISVLGGGPVPDTFEATGQEWLAYITGNGGRILISRLLLLLGDLLFLWFLGTLRARLLAAEGQPGRWTAIAFGSGIATAVMLIASATPVLAAAAAADALEPSAGQALAVAEYAFFIGAEIAGAALLMATGLLAIRTAVLPAWLGWASLVVALLLLTIIGPIGFIAIVIGFPLWVVVVSVLLWRRGERAVPARQTANPETPPS